MVLLDRVSILFDRRPPLVKSSGKKIAIEASLRILIIFIKLLKTLRMWSECLELNSRLVGNSIRSQLISPSLSD
jgi:hypothetical protein